MANKKHGLGRGLDALLLGARNISAKQESEEKINISDLSDPTENSKGKPKMSDNGFLEMALEKLRPGQYQPRQNFRTEELESLAASIRSQGVLQPLVVRSIAFNQYEIIAGERRFRAAGLAGLATVPVVIKQVTDEAALAMALIENIQRENLNALEEAVALDRLAKEFKLTHIEVAEAVGKSRTAVTNSLRLLTLAEEVKGLLSQGAIEAGHAKVLLGLRGNEQSKMAADVVAKGLSVRETERLVAKHLEGRDERFSRKNTLDPDVKRLQDDLSAKLGAHVEIQQGQQGKGKLVIQYNSLLELEGILEHIR